MRIVVHSLAHARAALEAAAETGVSVVLRSPASAATSQGIGWWRALTRLAAEAVPEADFVAVLDCGEAPGLALAAIRAGIGRVRLEADPETLRRVGEAAEQAGAMVDCERAFALDLLGEPDPRGASREYLRLARESGGNLVGS